MKNPKRPKEFVGLGTDALVVLKGVFGMMTGRINDPDRKTRRGELRVGNVENKVTDRTKLALDQLVAAKFISYEKDGNADVWRSEMTDDQRTALNRVGWTSFGKDGAFPLVEKIK